MSAALKVGDLVSSGSITWKVLAVKGTAALLLSKDILARLPYYIDFDEDCHGYADSIIRTWLNETFIHTLPYEFTKRIIPTKLEISERISNFDYAEYGIEEPFIEDKIFLLSEQEARALILSNSSRKASLNLDYIRSAEPHSFAATSRADRAYSAECNRWWLRTLDSDIHREVSASGAIIDTTAPLTASSHMVFDLDKALYDNAEPELLHAMLLLLGVTSGVVGLRTSFATALMGSRGYIGVRPALWLNFKG